MLIKLFVFCAIFAFGQCNVQLPSIDSFLQQIFNATIKEIANIVKTFTFQSIDTNNLKFLLYSHQEKNYTTNLKFLNPTETRQLDLNKSIKFIIHGWKSSINASYMSEMAKNYVRMGDCHVIGVDWSWYSKKNYLTAATSAKDVGEAVGKFILNLIGNNVKFLKNIHIVGHSLGAHVSGFAGQKIAEETQNKIARITGLDAAAPLFEYPIKMPSEFRLTSGDAVFVDGIHTNAGFFGFRDDYAVADYYVENGGPLQPGCVNILNAVDSLFCSHSKSHEYFDQSIIVPKKYESLSCSSPLKYMTLLCNNNKKAIMGEYTSANDTGRFYLGASSAYPYSALTG